MSKYPGRIVTDLAPAGYSVFFTGTSFLTVPAGTAFAPGTGNFTIEAWVYPTASGDRFIWTQTVSGTNYFTFGISTTTAALTMTASGGGTSILGPANSLVQNAWNHIAAVRSSGTVTVYVNGVGGTPTSNTLDLSNTTYTPTIGTYTHSTGFNVFAGYMSNLRYVKGTALYTANFAPPNQLFNVANTSFLSFNSPAIVDQSTANSGSGFPITASGLSTVSTFTPFREYVPYNPALGAATPGIWTVDEAMQAAATRQWNMYDPSFNLTTLLLHGNPPANVPTFITDASANNFAITPVGDTRSANLSPFSLTSFPNSGSGYFDGTGDWLTLPSTNALVFGTGDFCVEFWLNRTGTTGGIFSNSQSVGGGDTQFEIALNGSNRVILIGWNTTFMTGATTINTGTWYHIAVVRSGTSMAIFVNGTRDATATSANNFSSTNAFLIGSQAGGSGRTTGYVSNLRAVKGSFVYDPAQTTITVPSSPLTVITNTSLLTLQNSQSSNNNAFLDSSSNNFLITRNGNTTQGSFSPFSQTGWSNYFPGGNGKYIYAPYNAAFNFGTGDFSVECFAYVTDAGRRFDASKFGVFVSGGNILSLSGLWGFGFGISGGVINQLTFDNAGSAVLTASSQSISLNVWHHFVVCRTGTTLSIYVDGIRVATATYSAAVNTNSSGAIFISQSAYQDVFENWLIGNISNVRIIKGAQPYTATNPSITVPTTQLTNITNTSLLTCLSNRFIDTGTANGGNPFTITIVGTGMSIQAFSPFYPTAAYTPETIGGSGYFDGTGDYLTAAGNAAFAFGTGDFTVAAWIYPTAATTFTVLSSNYNFSSGSGNWSLYFGVGSAQTLYFNSGSGNKASTVTTTIPLNAWTHVAYTRVGTTGRFFVNGAQLGGTISDSFNYGGSSGNLFVGQQNDGTGLVNGYMTSIQVLKGTGYSSLPIPTAPATNITNTSILLNFTNAGVVDSTAKNALETVGDARISTTQSVFGGTSMSFNGTNSTLILRNSQLMNLGSSDFTLEFWMYRSAATASQPFYSLSGSSQTNSLALDMNASGGLLAYATASGGGTWGLLGGNSFGTVPLTTWTHVALVRNGSTWRGYLNGVAGFTVTNSSALASFDGASIGSSGASTLWFNGFIDDFRITRFARYTGNFTPQTSQWQDQ